MLYNVQLKSTEELYRNLSVLLSGVVRMRLLVRSWCHDIAERTKNDLTLHLENTIGVVADKDWKMSQSELRSVMIAQEYEENWENKSSGETVIDADEATLNSFYKNATNCGKLPELGTDALTLMHKQGLLNGEYPTNAGRMLISKHYPITLKMSEFATEHKNIFLDISRVEGNVNALSGMMNITTFRAGQFTDTDAGGIKACKFSFVFRIPDSVNEYIHHLI